MSGSSKEVSFIKYSFDAFYTQYYPIVVRYLIKRCTNRFDAEDLANTVFTYCFQHWDSYDATKASIQSWLFMIVRSRWKNYCRDKKISVDIQKIENTLFSDPDPLEQAIRLDSLRQTVAAALNAISLQQRDAIIMRFFQNLSNDEIAERMQITEGNVRVLIHRGLKSLRQHIDPADL